MKEQSAVIWPNWQDDSIKASTFAKKERAVVDGFTLWAEDDGDWKVFCYLPGIGEAMISGKCGGWLDRGRLEQARNAAIVAMDNLRTIHGAKGR